MSKTKMSPADLFTEQQLYSPPFNSDESRKAVCTDLLDIIKRNMEDFQVTALTCGSRIDLFEKQTTQIGRASCRERV